MASDTRKIVIEIINNDSDEKNEKNPPKKEDSTLKALQIALKPIKSLEKVIVGDSQSTKYVYDSLKNLAIDMTITTLSRNYRLSEDYLSQNALNNTQKLLGKAGGIASSMISGAMVGSALAPGVGTIVGAVLGTGFNIASEALAGTERLSQYYSSLNSASFQSEFSAHRAGLLNEGRGTEN